VPQNTLPRNLFLTMMMRRRCIQTFDLDVPRLGSSRSIFGTEQRYLFSAKGSLSIQPGGNGPTEARHMREQALKARLNARYCQ